MVLVVCRHILVKSGTKFWMIQSSFGRKPHALVVRISSSSSGVRTGLLGEASFNSKWLDMRFPLIIVVAEQPLTTVRRSLRISNRSSVEGSIEAGALTMLGDAVSTVEPNVLAIADPGADLVEETLVSEAGVVPSSVNSLVQSVPSILPSPLTRRSARINRVGEESCVLSDNVLQSGPSVNAVASDVQVGCQIGASSVYAGVEHCDNLLTTEDEILADVNTEAVPVITNVIQSEVDADSTTETPVIARFSEVNQTFQQSPISDPSCSTIARALKKVWDDSIELQVEQSRTQVSESRFAKIKSCRLAQIKSGNYLAEIVDLYILKMEHVRPEQLPMAFICGCGIVLSGANMLEAFKRAFRSEPDKKVKVLFIPSCIHDTTIETSYSQVNAVHVQNTHEALVQHENIAKFLGSCEIFQLMTGSMTFDKSKVFKLSTAEKLEMTHILSNASITDAGLHKRVTARLLAIHAIGASSLFNTAKTVDAQLRGISIVAKDVAIYCDHEDLPYPVDSMATFGQLYLLLASICKAKLLRERRFCEIKCDGKSMYEGLMTFNDVEYEKWVKTFRDAVLNEGKPPKLQQSNANSTRVSEHEDLEIPGEIQDWTEKDVQYCCDEGLNLLDAAIIKLTGKQVKALRAFPNSL